MALHSHDQRSSHRHDDEDHDHDHDHSHDHDYHHDRHHAQVIADHSRAFVVGILLNTGFVVVEVIYGFISNSLALLSDAGHNLSDVFGLLLAWGATYLATRPPTKHRTYGWRRASVLAALINAVALLIAVGVIILEAILRLIHPQPIVTSTMIWIAAAGIVVNAASAWLFAKGRKNDLNVRSAFMHLAADAVISLGVVIAGILIHYTGWVWLDPVVSIAVAAVITIGTWNLLRESLNLSMDAVPAHIDPHAVERYLMQLPDVKAVHDLHIWAMSTTEVAMTVHLVMQPMPADDDFLHTLSSDLEERFAIHHVTAQIEHGTDGMSCAREPAHVV